LCCQSKPPAHRPQGATFFSFLWSGRKCEVLQVGWYQWSVLKVCARRRAGRHRTFRLYCRCFVVGRFHPNISVWNVSSDVISVTRRFGQCTRYLQTKVRLLFDHYPHFTLSFLTGQYGIGYTQRRGLGKDLGWFVQEVEVDASRGTGLGCGSWLPGLWVAHAQNSASGYLLLHRPNWTTSTTTNRQEIYVRLQP